MALSLYFPGWPLAMYRELSVHLQQLSLIQTTVQLRSGLPFDYQLDQVDSLLVVWQTGCNLALVAQIVLYYVSNFPEIKASYSLKGNAPQGLGLLTSEQFSQVLGTS